MRRHLIDLLAGMAALVGAALAMEAWLAGSLLRYIAAGLLFGAALAVPGLTILLLRDRARRFWRHVLFALVPVVFLLLLGELVVRVFGPPALAPEVLVADARLGHVLQPGTGEADGWGFRNERVPERVDALFVGDSQTYGFFVARDEAFPAVFAQATGAAAYQMAQGSYGPVRYRELVRRGLALHPRLVVVAVYFGNDLFDATAGAALEGAEDLRAAGRSYPRPQGITSAGDTSPNWTMALVDGLQQHSRLLGAAGEALRSRLRGSTSLLDAQPGAVPFVDAAVGTILLPEYRRPVLDLDDPTIADGMRISERCLLDIGAACRAAKATCLVLTIPTKEYVYAEWRRRAGQAMPALAGLHAAETAARARLFRALAGDANLRQADLTEACIAELAAGHPLWAGNGDGHLMQAGHRLAAALVAAEWAKLR